MSAAAWKAEAINAVEHWLNVEGGGAREQLWRPLGRAQLGSEAGWLVLDKRGGSLRPDALNELCFAGEKGPDHGDVYPVETVRQVDEVLLLKEPAALPPNCMIVWTKNVSVRMLLEKLRDGLRSSDDSSLANALAERRLSGPAPEVPVPPGLVGAQPAAYRACLSPGLRLVWGPPGTGKTRILARAIEDLIKAGKRVLLVSTANVAVDNALAAVIAAVQPAAGVAIRVGPAQLAEVATNSDVHLEHLAATASAEVDRQLREVERQLGQLTAADAEIESLTAQLEGFDNAAYLAAQCRIENEAELARIASESAEAVRHHAAASEQAAAARAACEQLAQEWQRTAGARAALIQAQQAIEELQQLQLQRQEHQRDAAAAELALHQATGWWATRKAVRARDKAADALRTFERLATDQEGRLSDLVSTYRGRAHPVTDDHVAALHAHLETSRAAAEQAGRSELLTRDRLRALGETEREIAGRGVATPADHGSVSAARSANLPVKWERRKLLMDQRERAARGRGELEEKHRRLIDSARKLRRDAEKELIGRASLVATTLARSRLHPALSKAAFDVVLIDEAAAANLSEVLLCLHRAKRTAVLFGDFLQLAPIVHQDLCASSRQDVKRWILPDPFTHMGIRTPKDALDDPGCVVLQHQFRYGQSLRRLANDVIYDVLRDAADLQGLTARHDTEIVLIDTHGLRELGIVHQNRGKRGWWAAGVVLSRALAEHHVPQEGEIGIVTPYTCQRDATLAGLRDRKLVAGISAGTVHAFQGREFPVVVFDLVEDGQGWIAKARRDKNGYEFEGVRLFGVGITRARHRLYVVADRTAVKSAKQGPLAELYRARRRGEVRWWSGASLLGLSEPEPGSDYADDAYAEVSAMLGQFVSVTDINDEKTFYAELERRLSRARHEVWMWSPWVSTRARHVVPLIKQVADRGVDVTVFIRPDTDRNMGREWAQTQLPALYGSGATVIRSEHEHRKVIVIDENVVLFGSLNPLSSRLNNSTRENMLTLEGREFARRILEYLRARDHGVPKACPQCQQQCEIHRSSGRSLTWFWYCRNCRNRVKSRT